MVPCGYSLAHAALSQDACFGAGSVSHECQRCPESRGKADFRALGAVQRTGRDKPPGGGPIGRSTPGRVLVGGASALKRAIDIAAAGSALSGFQPLFCGRRAPDQAHRSRSRFFLADPGRTVGSGVPVSQIPFDGRQCRGVEGHLAAQNHHGGSVTFKMRNDPRITWIGRIIRKLRSMNYPNSGVC